MRQTPDLESAGGRCTPEDSSSSCAQLPVFLVIPVGFNRLENSLFVYYLKSVKQTTNTIALNKK